MISVKTMREFLNRIAVLYNKAKRRSYNVDKRVVKGRARCIAAQTEEAFANFVCQSILGKKHGFKVLVDFPITIECDGGKSTRYIDFILVKSIGDNRYEIRYMVELKMNIGWMRDRVLDTVKELRKQVEVMRQGHLSSRPGGRNSKRLEFVLPKRARYDLVIVSGVNGELEELKKVQSACNKRKRETTRLTILCDEAIEKGCKINEEDKCLLDRRMRAAVIGCGD